MSLTEITVTAQKDDVVVTVEKPPSVQLQAVSTPGLIVVAAGNLGSIGPVGPVGPVGPQGPEGPQGQWLSITQAEYDMLDPPNPDTLYVIVG